MRHTDPQWAYVAFGTVRRMFDFGNRETPRGKKSDTRVLTVGAWRRIGWRPGGTDSPGVKRRLVRLVRGSLHTEEAAGPHRLKAIESSVVRLIARVREPRG